MPGRVVIQQTATAADVKTCELSRVVREADAAAGEGPSRAVHPA